MKSAPLYDFSPCKKKYNRYDLCPRIGEEGLQDYAASVMCATSVTPLNCAG